MVFIDWYRVIVIAIGLVLIAACIWGLAYTCKLRNILILIAIRLVCVLLGATTSLILLLFIMASGCVSRSNAIFSPSGKMAVRIEDYDYGATGGDTSVDLIWAHGFRVQNIYHGEWKSVEQTDDIEWKSDTELVIHYHYDPKYNPNGQCYPAAVVHVSCLPK
jgi:hypothetical protein